MKRERTQLTIQASPELIAKVKTLADQKRQTITSIVIDAIEAYIEGNETIYVDPIELRRRIENLECRVDSYAESFERLMLVMEGKE